jgi:hypothetical protein
LRVADQYLVLVRRGEDLHRRKDLGTPGALAGQSQMYLTRKVGDARFSDASGRGGGVVHRLLELRVDVGRFQLECEPIIHAVCQKQLRLGAPVTAAKILLEAVPE